MLVLLLACGGPAPNPRGDASAPDLSAPTPEPVVEENRVRDETRYRRGAAAVVAHGDPCTVERVHLETGDRRTLFTTPGACPEHCAFEARMAVCVQGTAVMRHAFGNQSIVLVDEPIMADVERVFIGEDGVSHVLTLADGRLTEREVLVTGSRELRAQPADETGIRGFSVALSRRAYDLDSIQKHCPSGACWGFGEVHPDALAAFTERHGAAPGHVMLLPDRPVVYREVDGEPHAPVELCDGPACTTPLVVEDAPGPVGVVAHPPFLLLESGGRARVLGLDGAPSRDLGPVSWATFLPFDLSL